jgi:hypothetical protein
MVAGGKTVVGMGWDTKNQLSSLSNKIRQDDEFWPLAISYQETTTFWRLIARHYLSGVFQEAARIVGTTISFYNGSINNL